MNAPVIIVGGGPVGLSLALALARRSVQAIVLERNPQPVEESRALVIWPRTQEILRDWNAYDALRNAGEFVTDFTAINALNERRLFSVDFGVLNDVVRDPGMLIIPQSETERILRELVSANPYCELRTGVEVTGISQDSEYADVHFTAANGTDKLRGAYVVGCDGARGVVRQSIGLSLEGITYDSRIVLSDERIEYDCESRVRIRARLDEPGIRAAIRFAPNLWRVIASVGKEEEDGAAMSREAHLSRLCELFGEEVHATTLWSSLFKIHRRHAQRFMVGRVALAGDAAHLNSPAGGQGMNAGIQDAANLAWKVAFALKGRGECEALLESYDIERREMVTDTIERFTDRLTRVGMGFPPRARQLVVRAVSRAVRAYGMQCKVCRAMSMLSGRYTKSPIVDHRHPLAGRRIDDLLLANGSRLNEMRGGEAALVVAGEYQLDLPHIKIAVPPKRWHVKPPVVLIVRPDGCVATVIEKPTREKIETAWNDAFCSTLPLSELLPTTQ